ncbi:hypothetical protein XELAEV_18023664mg [Xenopus laevis]|uniref:Uncharacterized protein n=1 Tax=Xenopus laevis TaxID=8355 RepID=A0A974D6H5_XENLA|nr:hypothetical protein XELAEV_18023664mg [Xenopus laevis]
MELSDWLRALARASACTYRNHCVPDFNFSSKSSTPTHGNQRNHPGDRHHGDGIGTVGSARSRGPGYFKKCSTAGPPFRPGPSTGVPPVPP